jgi:hypothetical protein
MRRIEPNPSAFPAIWKLKDNAKTRDMFPKSPSKASIGENASLGNDRPEVVERKPFRVSSTTSAASLGASLLIYARPVKKKSEVIIMPRPKRTNESLRQYHVGIRLNESEYEKVRRESEDIGVTLSEYVRAKTTKGFIRVPKYAKIDTDAINMLSKLGGLFKKTHIESGGIYSRHTAAILDEIFSVIIEIRKGLEDDRETHSKP